MRVISGNPNVSGFEVHSNLKLEEHNDVNTSPNGGESCHYFSDFDAGRKVRVEFYRPLNVSILDVQPSPPSRRRFEDSSVG